MAQPRTIELFFDVGSPYSYLAATQIGALADRVGADVQWKPFLLGAVFKATGNDMPARLEPKARFIFADLQRWAKRYGVALNFPSRFPLNTLATQRALVAAERVSGPAQVGPFALALYRAYWVDDRDVSQPEEIGRVAGTLGLDAGALLAAMGEPETKDRLRALTEEAVERGAFGAPTLFVEDQMFWGNDRLQLLEDYLTG